MRQTGNRQRERVVAAAGAALPHDQPDADADEDAAEHGGGQRVAGKVGQHRRELLPELVKQRDAAGRYHRGADKRPAEVFEREQIAGGVQNRRDHGRRNAEPVLHEQHGPEHAALRDAGPLVDIVDAEGADRRAEHDNRRLSPRQPLHKFVQKSAKSCQKKPSLHFMPSKAIIKHIVTIMSRGPYG